MSELPREHDSSGELIALGVSVVVPAHGRRELVRMLLASLEPIGASRPEGREVLVLDSSDAEDAEAIQLSCEHFGARYVPHAVNNVRQKRNVGIHLAQYPVVLFIDSDCTASPDLLFEHARSHGDGVGGVVGFTRFVGPGSLTWSVIERTSVLDSFSYAARLKTAPWGPTCNISYRKEVLEAVGGFDESFPFRLGGDDVDLGLRVTDAGYSIRCNPNAEVEHTRETWNGPLLIGRRVFRWGRMHFHLMRKHPHRVLLDFPKTMGLFTLLAAVLTTISVVCQQPSLILLSLAWLGGSTLLEAFLLARLEGNGFRNILPLMGGRLLGLTFELGTLVEGMRHGSARPFFSEIHYVQPSPHSIGRKRRAMQLWAALLALLALLPVLAWVA